MKRTEQIRQASIEYTYRNTPMCIGGGAFSEMVDEMNRNKSFEEGAKWADETMLERACGILEDMTEGRLGKRFISEFQNKLKYGVLERH